MKKCYCDLCKKEIKLTDIPTSFEINIGGKSFDLDMHSECYYLFIEKLKENLEKNE